MTKNLLSQNIILYISDMLHVDINQHINEDTQRVPYQWSICSSLCDYGGKQGFEMRFS